MTPFAYQCLDLDYDCVRADIVAPTLRAAYEATVKAGVEPGIKALYPDGRTKQVPVKWFKARIKLDRVAIRKEVAVAIKGELKWWGEYQAKLAARDPNEPVHLVTGSYEPGPPSTNVKARVAQIVAERQWGWKTADEIDWAALEAVLTR